ncbi:GAL4 enhancer protein [Microbotryomycetes sp. JL221]|nr:GAL4 enhancer protein [Microbotryomycetes sp. JL221]
MSDDETNQQGTVTIDSVEGTRSRGETKSRKALSKLGLKQVEGVTRVVMRRPRGQLVVIAQPEVYKSPVSDCYVVFGEARTDDNMAQSQFLQAHAIAQAEMERQAKEAASKGGESSGAAAIEDKGKADGAAADEADDADVDSTGVEEDDIQVVMQQSNCSRAKAVKALKATNGDIVQAILDAN